VSWWCQAHDVSALYIHFGSHISDSVTKQCNLFKVQRCFVSGKVIIGVVSHWLYYVMHLNTKVHNVVRPVVYPPAYAQEDH